LNQAKWGEKEHQEFPGSGASQLPGFQIAINTQLSEGI